MNTDRTKHNLIFVSNSRVGTIGTIYDGVYNTQWVIYTVSNNYCQLFPMHNLDYHRMNDSLTTDGGYPASEMHEFIHDTILSRLKDSTLNITSLDLVTRDVYEDIISKTGKTSRDIAVEGFWLADPYSSYGFYAVGNGGSIIFNRYASGSYGVRPLITVKRESPLWGERILKGGN